MSTLAQNLRILRGAWRPGTASAHRAQRGRSWARVEGAGAGWRRSGTAGTHQVPPGEGAGHRCRAEGDAALLVRAVVEAGLRPGRAPRGPGLRPGRVPQAARPSCAATRPGSDPGCTPGWRGGRGRAGGQGVLSAHPQQELGPGSGPGGVEVGPGHLPAPGSGEEEDEAGERRGGRGGWREGRGWGRIEVWAWKLMDVRGCVGAGEKRDRAGKGGWREGPRRTKEGPGGGEGTERDGD